MRTAVLAVATAAVACVSQSHAAQVTPTQKVIQLLEDMKSKCSAEKEHEVKVMDTFFEWCDDTQKEKGFEIQDDNRAIEKNEATLAKAQSDIKVLSDQIQSLDNDIAKWEADAKSGTELRAKEKDEYETLHADYSESLYALDKAIQTLKKQDYTRAQAFLQRFAVMRVQSAAHRQARDMLKKFTPPQAAGYEAQSGGVIAMLENLKEKFSEENDTLEKREKNSKHAHEMMILDLEDQVTYANSDRSKKAAAKGEAKALSAETTSALNMAREELAADEKYLQDTTTECNVKDADFKSRQQLRVEEIQAVAKAIEILSGDSVSGNADKHLPSLAQVSFVQLHSATNVQKAFTLLTARAKSLNSRALAMVVASMKLDDPFTKVRNMIKDMISKLTKEAEEEAEAKGWCDKELRDNKLTRTAKTEERDTLQSKVDLLTSEIAQLTEEMNALQAAMAANDSAMAKSTEERNAEKAKNAETVQDSKDAQEAISQAVKVLKEFYGHAAEATALVQAHDAKDDAPESFTKAYKGLQSENGGVLSFLEVIASDFARVQSDTESSEAAATQEYDQFMADTTADNEAKHQSHLQKERSKQSKEITLERTQNKHLRRVQEQLDAATDYYDKLKAQCLDNNLSYADRVKAREAEIQSLQEAYKILDGQQ